MSAGRLLLVGGGVRSGKSRLALTLAEQAGRPITFIATAEARDDEMRERVRRHQAERGPHFVTIEEPLQLCEALARAQTQVVVIDCLTLWLTNRLLREEAPHTILDEASRLAALCRARAGTTILVTSEVGLGLVPESKLGRAFRDLAGEAHQRLAAQADEVYFGAMGMMLRLKPSPLAVAPQEHGR